MLSVDIPIRCKRADHDCRRNAELYKAFATNEGRNTSTRNRGMDGALSGSNSWAANPVSIWTFDGKPVGRRAVGITEEGDLVIL